MHGSGEFAYALAEKRLIDEYAGALRQLGAWLGDRGERVQVDLVEAHELVRRVLVEHARHPRPVERPQLRRVNAVVGDPPPRCYGPVIRVP